MKIIFTNISKSYNIVVFDIYWIETCFSTCPKIIATFSFSSIHKPTNICILFASYFLSQHVWFILEIEMNIFT